MLTPLGVTPIAMMSAPSSHSAEGATLYAAPLAQSITTRRPSRRRSPSGPNSLMPLSAKGLWLAEIITPMSARIVWVSIATAGVGSGPTMMTSMPALVKPATSADSSI
ncbi:hypothetical protein WR25_01194 [Diploscapter pachys]|uniref:Uncharacterized protein n=1 Tax=Diploscapter pachys TaxID=2018661 RepID=A0A2A2K510_9BILA|nr:hypothetical protein WR25_01194 [Diploscapter pachys]